MVADIHSNIRDVAMYIATSVATYIAISVLLMNYCEYYCIATSERYLSVLFW